MMYVREKDYNFMTWENKQYKELEDKIEDFENIYKKEHQKYVNCENWVNSGDDNWNDLLTRNESVMKDISELRQKLTNALREKREIRKEMSPYMEMTHYVRNYNDRKTAYEKRWDYIDKKFSNIKFTKLYQLYHKKEFPSLYSFDIPDGIDDYLDEPPINISISEEPIVKKRRLNEH